MLHFGAHTRWQFYTFENIVGNISSKLERVVPMTYFHVCVDSCLDANTQAQSHRPLMKPTKEDTITWLQTLGQTNTHMSMNHRIPTLRWQIRRVRLPSHIDPQVIRLLQAKFTYFEILTYTTHRIINTQTVVHAHTHTYMYVCTRMISERRYDHACMHSLVYH